MFDTGIESEDRVVIDGEQVVSRSGIGVVYYNGVTTLKRVVPMGDSILLMSENSEYEPIQNSEGDFEMMDMIKKIYIDINCVSIVKHLVG